MGLLAQQSQLTLVELAKRTNNGNILTIAEVLAQVNEIIQDAVWIESNQATSHVGTVRTHLPTGSWRRINAGVASEASSTRQVTEGMGMLESYSKVDCKLCAIAPNPQQFRSDEDKAFIEGMGQNFVYTILYGNLSTDPEAFNGLATRYNLTSLANVIGGGGTGSDTTSLWIIDWGPTACHLIYPKGSTTGLSHRDLGEQTVSDGAGGEYQAYRTHFKIDGGLFVHDDRCIQRIANIETSGAVNTLSDNDIIELLNQMPTAGGTGSTRIYVNRTLKTQFDILAKDKSNVNYTSDTAFGKPVTNFRGVPVRLVEQILSTETAIS